MCLSVKITVHTLEPHLQKSPCIAQPYTLCIVNVNNKVTPLVDAGEGCDNVELDVAGTVVHNKETLIYLIIYSGFYVAFNTVQVMSQWVVGRAEETST